MIAAELSEIESKASNSGKNGSNGGHSYLGIAGFEYRLGASILVLGSTSAAAFSRWLIDIHSAPSLVHICSMLHKPWEAIEILYAVKTALEQ